MSTQQLQDSKGTPVRFGIRKCIDKEAWIEMQVKSILPTTVKKDVTFLENSKMSFSMKPETKTPDKIPRTNFAVESNLIETKSELCLPGHTTPSQKLQHSKIQRQEPTYFRARRP